MDWESKEDINSLTTQMRASTSQFSAKLTVSEQQQMTTKKRIIKGPMWVAKFEISPPEEDQARTLLLKVIDDLADQKVLYTRPKSEAIHIEWIGDRKGAGENTPEPFFGDEKLKFGHILADNPGPGVIMFIYGGAFFANNQDRYRKIISRLSRMTGLPCVTIHQRLAPQNPFPAALLDIFFGYLSLLAAPPPSPHSPKAGKSIIIAGDSSGACLALGLLQVLLNLKRNEVSTIEFHGRKVKLELPAGLTLLSAVGDLTNSLPSYKENFLTDWFPACDPKNLPGFPICEIWPADPPRGNIYCDTSILDHSLASPTASRDWTGSPPLWFASGQEMIVDAAKLIAQTAFSQGTTVIFQEYESMPHIFMTQFLDSPQSRKCWNDWAEVCKSLTNGDAIASKAEFIKAKGLQVEQLDLTKLTKFTVGDARRRMRQAAKAMTPFTGQREDVSKL